jgi:hypothetical protein
MKLISPVNDLIQQTIQLYLELLQTAEEIHDLGGDSGIKRTILLQLYQSREILVDDLVVMYPLPPQDGLRIVEDLIQKGYISRFSKHKSIYISLTLPGSNFAEQLMLSESEFFRHIPVPLPLANMREAAATLEVFLEAMRKAREAKNSPKAVGF